ncbi:hypothetical protein [Noviherbaspirillum sp.]|uniref:hypothetical protein n=1 Tax=Noviherbaspirillum sp. TaxID=1926288 RepID=UPI002DDCFF88|nr:hypothetical protein [Noviherbaspirillum sp.]
MPRTSRGDTPDPYFMHFKKLFATCACGAFCLAVSGCAVVSVATTAVSVAGTAVSVGVAAGSVAVGAATTVAKGAVAVGGAVVGSDSD